MVSMVIAGWFRQANLANERERRCLQIQFQNEDRYMHAKPTAFCGGILSHSKSLLISITRPIYRTSVGWWKHSNKCSGPSGMADAVTAALYASLFPLTCERNIERGCAIAPAYPSHASQSRLNALPFAYSARLDLRSSESGIVGSIT